MDVRSAMKRAPWFGRVGKAIEVDFPIFRRESWDEAYLSAAHAGTVWCNVEAGLILYRGVADAAYSQFVRWNDIAKEHSRIVEEVMGEIVLPRMPDGVEREGGVAMVRSILVGALMETRWEDVVPKHLHRRSLALLLQGYFPCGWALNSADEFPDKAVLIVF